MSTRLVLPILVALVGAACTSAPTAVSGPTAEPTPATIAWPAAEARILAGDAAAVMQAHSLEVIITLKTGRRIHTVEPEIDEVLRVIDRCGEACRDIVVATE